MIVYKLKQHLNRNTLCILFIILAFACEEKRAFVWTEDIAQITDKNLAGWIEKSPFDGKWNKNKTDKNVMVFDNRNQVFPFMGKFTNELDNFKNETYGNGDIYQEEVLLYKDSIFGESFVYGALIFEPQELFLRNYYSERGDILFSGQNGYNETYTASLSETLLFDNNETYKAAVYRVNSNYKSYLFGFYQRGRLLYQFGFLCTDAQTQKGLYKIKEINTTLNLNIAQWSQATVESLQININPQGFWENPYQGIYLGEYMLPEVNLKIKNTSFKELPKRVSREKGVDYTFVNETEGKEQLISFKRESTPLSKQAFEDQFKDNRHITSKDYEEIKLFITNEAVVNGITYVDVKTFFKNNTYLKIQIQYPEGDANAKEQVFDILKTIKVNRF